MLMIYFRVIFASKFHMEIFKIFSNLEISPVEYRLQRFRFQRKFGFEKKTDFLFVIFMNMKIIIGLWKI